MKALKLKSSSDKNPVWASPITTTSHKCFIAHIQGKDLRHTLLDDEINIDAINLQFDVDLSDYELVNVKITVDRKTTETK